VSSDKIVPIVVFSERSKLSKIEIGGVHNVFRLRDAVKYIKKCEKTNEIIFDLDETQKYLIRLIEDVMFLMKLNKNILMKL
jgi:hypothetical protein